MDASRAAIVLCGRLGLASRAESTARRMVDDFGDIFGGDQRGAAGAGAGAGAGETPPPSNPAPGSTVLGASGYAGLAAAYARSHEIGKLETMRDSLAQNRIRSSRDVYSEIFKGFIACWRVEDAVAVAAQAKERGVALPRAVWEEGIPIFTSSAEGRGGAGRLLMGQHALALLRAMGGDGHVPSQEALQGMLTFLIGGRHRENVRIVDDIAEVFHLCLVSGYQPRVETYADIIHLLGRARRFQDAVELFVSLYSSRGGPGGAGVPTYEICESLLSAAAAAQAAGEVDPSGGAEDGGGGAPNGAVADAFALYQSFMKVGVRPSVEMYNIAAGAAAVQDDWEAIYEIMEDMRAEQLYPTAVVVRSALAALRRKRMLQLSTELFEHQERLRRAKDWQQQRERMRTAGADLGLDDACYSEVSTHGGPPRPVHAATARGAGPLTPRTAPRTGRPCAVPADARGVQQVPRCDQAPRRDAEGARGADRGGDPGILPRSLPRGQVQARAALGAGRGARRVRADAAARRRPGVLRGDRARRAGVRRARPAEGVRGRLRRVLYSAGRRRSGHDLLERHVRVQLLHGE